MSERKHSPLPWKFGTPRMKTKIFATDPKRGPYTVLDVRGWGYFTGKGHGALGLSDTEAMAHMDANADFILTACNSHYELVEVLEGLIPQHENEAMGLEHYMEACDEYGNDVPEHIKSELKALNEKIETARAALAKAKGES